MSSLEMLRSELESATATLIAKTNEALAQRALQSNNSAALQQGIKCLIDESREALLDATMTSSIPDSRPMLTKRQLSRHLGKRGRESS